MAVKTAEQTLTIEELTEIATDFLRGNYGMELEIPIVRNNRLRTKMGIFYENRDGTSHSIEIAGYMFKYATREVLIDTLLHECIHYALFERGESYEDGHPYFEAELRRFGASSTGTNIVGLYFEGKCRGCGAATYGRNKRIAEPNRKFTSTCCGTSVDYVGERIYNGTEAI